MSGGVFVAGFGSGAGKSTMCLALLSWATAPLAAGGGGLTPAEVAYIKPATQCERPTPVVRWCESRQIRCVGVGPVVFRKGFTNDIVGAADPVARGDALLASCVGAVDALRDEGRAFVVVDGVGYPSVGSCCGVGNGALAAALELPVLLVGPGGLGDALDTFELMATYMGAKGAAVWGAVQNKAADTERHKVAEALPLVRRFFELRWPAVRFLGAARRRGPPSGSGSGEPPGAPGAVCGREDPDEAAAATLADIDTRPFVELLPPLAE